MMLTIDFELCLFFQNELHINNTARDSSGPPNDSELGRQVYTKDTYKREGNGSESTDIGGTNSSTQTILANEQGNIAYENEDIETYGHDEVHAKGENSAANDIRGQASITENAGEAKERSINGHANHGKKIRGAGDASQDGDPTTVQRNGPQEVGGKNSTNHEVGTHVDGVAMEETMPQREGEGGGTKGVEVTASTEGEAGLDNPDGSPSGNGENGDEVMGSGDDEAPEEGDKKGGHDDSEGHEEQSHQGKDDNRGQSSVSGEDGDSKEKEGSPNGCGADGTTSSEENKNIEEGNGSQALQENEKLRDPEGGITCQSETCPQGKSQDQVSFETDPFPWWLTSSPPHSNVCARQLTTNPDKYKIKPQTNTRNVTISVWVHFF